MGGLGVAENEVRGATDRTRFLEMDVFKGLLIVLVIVGHLIPQYDALVASDGWRRVLMAIYGFHMQAFAFVAGFCSARLLEPSEAKSGRAFACRRAERLMVPYFVWGGLYFVARLIVPSLGAESYDFSRAWQFFIGYNPDGALWFLWTLFAATLIVQGALRVCSLGRVAVAATLLCVLALWTQPWLPLPVAVNELPLFVFFFAAGLLVRSHAAAVRPFLENPAFGVGTIVVWFLVQTLHPLTVMNAPWYLPGVTSVLGTAAFLFLSVRIARSSLCLKTPFVFLSAYAMEIFILAEPVKVVCRTVFRRMGLPVSVSFAVMFVLMLAVPVFLTRYVLRGKWPQLLLLGKRTEVPRS